ncbi:hypothetical protein F5Y16DRAFT_396632 [Xylariaceae sp. FL0255]|nr:hypothetical protein F5Y16DRAFT_396632 [Xylariaceae sp. FL0255]
MSSRVTRQMAMPLRAAIAAPTRQQQLFRATSSPFSKSWQRFSSSNEKPQGSLNQANFYRTFSRPIAKVLLVAMFTYQVAYYFWVRLEQNESKAELQGAFALWSFVARKS